MGMGYAGGHVVKLDEKLIKSKCPKLLAEFKKVVDKYGPSDVFYVVDGQSNVDEESEVEILIAHNNLVNAFKAKTGLEISYFYHDIENDGDRYDEVGEAWCVENAYQMTKVAKPYEKYIEWANFVMFG